MLADRQISALTTFLHLLIDLRQVQHILYAVFLIILMHGPLAKVFYLSLRPHLMESILVHIQSMSCLIHLENLIQPHSLYIHALIDHIFCQSQSHLFTLLCPVQQGTILILLDSVCLKSACIQYVNDACLHILMECQGIMPAIMKNLDYFRIDQDISQDLLGQHQGLFIFILLHLVNIQ